MWCVENPIREESGIGDRYSEGERNKKDKKKVVKNLWDQLRLISILLNSRAFKAILAVTCETRTQKSNDLYSAFLYNVENYFH